MLKMKVTIKEISEKIGISSSTISRVLTNQGYVKPETRKIIEQALTQYNYKYKTAKKAENPDALNAVLVIAGDISSQVYVGYVRGICDTLEKQGIKTLVSDSEYNTEKDEDYIKFAMQNRFAGIIMLSVIETDSLYDILRESDFPVVLVNRYLRSLDMDEVCVDNIKCGYIATNYLIHKGHRRIAHLGGPKNSTTCQDRLRGYREAMQHADCAVEEDDVCYAKLHYEDGYQFGLRLARDRRGITAVFSSNDIMAAGLVDALFESGLTVPGDISVICADNTTTATNGRVKLTTVSHDSFDMGAAAAELLLERLENPDMRKKKVVYSPEITKRDSIKRVAP